MIPGGTYEAALSQLRDRSAIRKNRRKSQSWCKRLHENGVIPKPANSECDEFPFASTWQGSNR
ncbi:NucA/NucB deoxyribonuclease domain-containing protein [Kroppenstedtia sanguinis]